jgi:hypothetical protein
MHNITDKKFEVPNSIQMTFIALTFDEITKGVNSHEEEKGPMTSPSTLVIQKLGR